MPQSVIDFSAEKRLLFGIALINKLARIGVLTDALVAAATSFQDLLDDLAAAFKVADVGEKYGPEVKILIRAMSAELAWRFSLPDITAPDTTTSCRAFG